MKIIRNKNIKNYLFLMSFLMIIEFVFRMINSSSLFTFSLIRIFFADSVIAILISLVSSLFKDRASRIINVVFIFAFCFYAWLQLSFNTYIGVYLSVNASSQLGAVKEYIGDFVKAIKPINYLMFIPFILSLVTLSIQFYYKKKNNINDDYKFKYHNKMINNLTVCIILIISSLAFYISLDDSFSSKSFDAVSNKELFISASNPALCIKNFGISSFSIIDFKTKLYDVKESNELYYAMAELKEETNNTRYIDDTNWNNLIENETRDVYNNLNNYYISSSITDRNEYTGLFENKNLIIIMMESVNDIFVNKDYFPNFYKMVENGWYFKNNYSPRNSCATGNNEFSALTGLYSISNVCTANVYKNNKYYEAIFNLFNNKDYNTSSYHNFTEGYYYRETIHPNMGSNKYYGVQELDIPFYTYYGGWASDEDLMNKYLELLDDQDNSKPFMNFITTVTSHQPYSDSVYGNLYYDMTENTTLSSNIRRYYSKLKVLDNSLGILMDGLDKRGMLDDTVFVLFGDHYPYGLKNEYLEEVLDRSLDDYEIEKTPLVIYNTSLTGKVNDTYTSYVNLTPTLANLFNLDYDPRLYAGHDIFSSDYDNTVVFADSSWKNDVAYYDASKGEIKYYTDFIYTNEEIIDINKRIYAKMNSSTLAIKNKYFEYLDKNLNELNDGKEN